METGKTTRYLKYAIGEIILVVIGILIALQINNWNENRKDRFVEKTMLQAINNDIKTDISAIKSMLALELNMLSSNRELISILKDKQSKFRPEYKRTFKLINRYGVFFPQKMGYETLKSKGLEIIRNDHLRSEIVSLYDFQYGNTAEIMDIKKQMFLNSNPIFNTFLETLDDGSRVPNDFNAVKNSALFMNYLTQITAEKLTFISYSETALKAMETTSANIEKELNK
jgi:hypothetical protein